jgi:tape measure domain-containing protein
MEGGDYCMSSKVDDRIVNMKFNNAQFEKGVADTSKSLETLKKGLDLKNVGKGIGDLAGSIKNLSLDGLANGVQNIAGKFTSLSVIGVTALANIANKAIDTGLQLVKSLTIDPIKAGLEEYELKMGTIQTILANTSRYGTQLPEVTANLEELNAYADKTIYNFGDMTKNIGLFTNAGLRIEDATAMIKGFSNEAAASGTNAQGAAGAAYQLSQALSAGTIRLMDWRSLTNVGMGNKNMQTGLIEIADAMGTLTANTTSAEEVQADFNGSLEKNWLSADVMSTYLKIMSQDTEEAAFSMAKAAGLSDEMATSLAKQAVTANEAATKVRTWTQLVGTMQEAVGSGWSETFDILIGDFDEATELWTNVNNVLGGIVGEMSDARNDLLEAWSAGGGRDALINSVANAWKAAVGLITPIKEAFEEIFPPMTAQKLIDITKAVESFTKSLIPSEKTMENIKSTAKGFFAVLDIGWMILQQVIGLFGRLLGAVTPASGGILEMSGNLGDWLVTVRDAIKNGEGLGKVFDFIGKWGEKTIGVISNIGKWIKDTFFDVEEWGNAWENIGNAIKSVWNWLQPFFQWVGEAFTNIKNVASEFFASMDFSLLVGALNVGLLGGVILLVKRFLDKLPGMFSNIGGGIFDSIKGVFTSLTDTLGAMQAKLKAEILTKIAIAIGILAASLLVLSFIEPERLVSSLTAIALGMGILIKAMTLLDKTLTGKEVAKVAALSTVLTILATSLLILAGAMAIIATLDWNELAIGLTGVGVGLGILVGALKLMDTVKGSIGPAAAGMLVLSTAVVILAAGMKIFASMSWDDILRAGTILAATIGVLVGASALIKKAVAGAPAMIIMSVALTIMAGALKVFATMSWDDILRAMTVMAAAIGIMVGAVAILSALKMAPVGAATMIAMSVAITILTVAMKQFAEMSWDEIGRSLTMLAASLAILALAMALMGIPIVLLGAVGIVAAAAAMMVLAPALVLLGTMSWDAIGRGLTMLAASLVILAAGGVLLLPAIPAFMALGIAAALIGAGAFLAGAGLLMFSAGFIALTGAAVLGSEAIKMALMTLIELIPAAMAAFAQGIIDFALVIANGGVEFTAAMTTLLTSLITAIGTVGPLVINTLWDLLMLMAAKLEENVPILVEKGGNLIIGVLNGMESKVPGIARAGTNLMIALMRAISAEVPRLADEGAKAIIRLVNGISTAIDNNAAAMGAAGGRLAAAIVRGMVNGIGAGVGEIISAAQNMANSALNAAKNALGIRSPSRKFFEVGDWSTEGLAKGLTETVGVVERAGAHVGEAALMATKKSLSNIASSVSSEMSLNPSIRPVLDLSGIRQDAALLGGILTPPALTLDRSIAYASEAQATGDDAQRAKNEAEYQQWMASRKSDVIFNQTNNSPKALSDAEIYRKTNNQLSVAKKELTTTDA